MHSRTVHEAVALFRSQHFFQDVGVYIAIRDVLWLYHTAAYVVPQKLVYDFDMLAAIIAYAILGNFHGPLIVHL